MMLLLIRHPHTTRLMPAPQAREPLLIYHKTRNNCHLAEVLPHQHSIDLSTYGCSLAGLYHCEKLIALCRRIEFYRFCALSRRIPAMAEHFFCSTYSPPPVYANYSIYRILCNTLVLLFSFVC